MSTDIAHLDDENLELEIRYSETVAGSDLLPQAYRGRPANVLIAVGLGRAMGLSRAESLYRIDVIQGKPTAAAELIAANVRKAGHKIRTLVNEDEVWAETTIVRRDDPDNPIVVRRDMAWAQKMGLANKDNYKKQPATMLGWRSISACARLACSEALYGVQYTADELTEGSTGKGGASDASSTPTVTAATFTAAKPEPGTGTVTEGQRDRLNELFTVAGIPAENQRAYIADRLGRDDNRRKLTTDEADAVIAHLERDLADEDTAVDAEIIEEPPTNGPTS